MRKLWGLYITWLHKTDLTINIKLGKHLGKYHWWYHIDYEVQVHSWATDEGWSIAYDGSFVVEYEPTLWQALKKARKTIKRIKKWERSEKTKGNML